MFLGTRLGGLGPLGPLSPLVPLVQGGHLIAVELGRCFPISLTLFCLLSPFFFGSPPVVLYVLDLFLGTPNVLIHVPPHAFWGLFLSQGNRSLAGDGASGLTAVIRSCGRRRRIPLVPRGRCLPLVPGSRGPYRGTLFVGVWGLAVALLLFP